MPDENVQHVYLNDRRILQELMRLVLGLPPTLPEDILRAYLAAVSESAAEEARQDDSITFLQNLFSLPDDRPEESSHA